MKHLFLILLLLAGCATPPATKPTEPPLPECAGDNGAREDAAPIRLGSKFKGATGERYWGLELDRDRSLTLRLDNIISYEGLGFAVYQNGFNVIKSGFFKDYRSTFSADFDAAAGPVVISVTHIVKLGEENCNAYTLSVF